MYIVLDGSIGRHMYGEVGRGVRFREGDKHYDQGGIHPLDDLLVNGAYEMYDSVATYDEVYESG